MKANNDEIMDASLTIPADSFLTTGHFMILKSTGTLSNWWLRWCG